MGRLHDLRCLVCKAEGVAEVRGSQWEGKTEPEDYITCVECGYHAENLTSHLNNTHPDYRERHPDALVVALGSAVRDKSALKGRTVSLESRKKMSENAGRWNAGLTKEDHPSIAAQAEKMRGREPWSKGLSASEDERLQATVAKLKTYVGENRPWHNGLRAELTLEDFAPFLDADGCVDRKAITEALEVSWKTIFTYMGTFDLETSDVHVQARHAAQVIELDKEVLESFVLGNGKVSIARAMRDTGHCFKAIQRECGRHGLETFHRHIRQTLCLDAVSEALGGGPYTMEWRDRRFMSAKNAFFRFDGYFKGTGLIVEFHGHQHYLFPNAFMVDESYRPLYEAMRERDRVKKSLIDAAPGLTYFVVRYDEPYDDPVYLRGRLVGAGVLAPGGGAGASTLEMFSGSF